jgi:RND family efflux transporter MFP subunit
MRGALGSCLLVTLGVAAPLVASAQVELPRVFDCLIEPYLVAEVGAHVEGIIEELKVDRGDFVTRGQVLATLESSVELANVELAQARAETTSRTESAAVRERFGERKHERILQLRRDGQYASDFEVDEADTERSLASLARVEADEDQRLAQLELNRARDVLELRTVRSPVNGVVVQRYLNPSERVQEEPILQVAQIDPLNVEVILPAAMLGKVERGMVGLVTPEVADQPNYEAQVTVVDNVVNAASGMFGVRLRLPNPDLVVAAGLRCQVAFLPSIEKAVALTE